MTFDVEIRSSNYVFPWRWVPSVEVQTDWRSALSLHARWGVLFVSASVWKGRVL